LGDDGIKVVHPARVSVGNTPQDGRVERGDAHVAFDANALLQHLAT